MSDDSQNLEQIKLAARLLKTMRHAAYATVNKDGSPHNSPLKLIYNENLTKLYVSTYSSALHTKNLIRTGKVFVVIYDSFTKGKGGVYITGTNAHECESEELVEALRVHNQIRARDGSAPIDISYYQRAKPSQCMYAINIEKIELYSLTRDEDGMIAYETRVQVAAKVIAKEL